MPRYACMSAAIASASWASRSACSGSPCAIATRARVVSAPISHQPGRGRDRFVGPAAGREQIPARQRGLAHCRRAPSPPARPAGTQVLPGRLGRVLGRRGIAGGQGRGSQRRVGDARAKPAKLGRGFDGRVGGGPGRTRLTLDASPMPWNARLCTLQISS